MTREEVFLTWAPQDSIWSPWVLPVPFAQLNCLDFTRPAAAEQAMAVPTWLREGNREGQAFVVDIPGRDAMKFGLALADIGIRPVPVIDGSPGAGDFYFGRNPEASTKPTWHPNVVVDMTELLRTLCEGAARLKEVVLPPVALPAFLLDSDRRTGHRPAQIGMYDNRWQVFAQDFPSAKFLLGHGVRRVLLVQERTGQPQEDLAHVLLRWQEGGIAIESVGTKDGSVPEAIQIAKPSRFRRIWYRALAMLRFRRNWTGGFGGFESFPMGSGG
ncbi:MAG TPA: hypothetical protein VKP58_09675 [Candidatus Acidoferrum sp.]|nr:hypothetical protein [Candidatus Acidoferrum sp.]